MDTPPQIDAPPEPTLSLILRQMVMTEVDDANPHVSPVELDPEKLRGQLKDKVDAVRMVLKMLEGRKKGFEDFVVEFATAAATIQKNIDSLNAYVVNEMQAGGFEKLPGHRFRFTLVTPEKLSYDRKAVPDDYFKLKADHPDLITMTTAFAFDWKEVQRLHKAGTLPDGIASKKRGKPYVKLAANTPERKRKETK